MQTIIQTPTNQIKQSLDFYQKLGFTVIQETKDRVFVTDSKVIIEINADRFARAAVKLQASESWEPLVKKISELTYVMDTDDGFVFNDPSGTWIYLQEIQQSFKIEEMTASSLGNFAGVSLEMIDIEKSMAIWELLGFQKSAGDLAQGWLSLRNQSGMDISLMKPFACPHLFFNPSLTYFNGSKNMDVIEEVRNAEIPITEEITEFNKEGIVDNIIIRDPGGLGFFLFND